jgi:chaperonin GroEL
MNNKIEFNPTALDTLATGVHKLGKAVKVTLGPKGRNVVFVNSFGVPEVTKDGVTVAREVNLEDPIENIGCQIAKQAAATTAYRAGDGTTTATILTDSLVTGSLKLIRSGIAPITVKRKFDELTADILDQIEKAATPVVDKDIYNIATISANNDTVIGGLISAAFDHVGRDGVITVEDSKMDETFVNTVDGFSFDKGLVSTYFATDPIKQEAIYEDPLILITDKKIRAIQEISSVVEQCLKTNKPLVIIADEIEGQALSLLVVNRLRTGLRVVAIKAPAYGERRAEILKDIAIATGGTLISETSGMKLEETKLEQLGSCKKIIVSKDETIMLEVKGDAKAIEERIATIREQIPTANDSYTSEKLMDRLAKLSGKVAVLFVGATTDTELREKKARIDDALRATRSAVTKGFVVGGGTLLAKLSKKLDNNDLIAKVYAEALQEPMRIIAQNAGVSSDVVANTVLEGANPDWGYNAKDDVYEDLVRAGIIDPALVVMEALRSANSAATMILLSDCVLYSDTPITAELADHDY